MIRKFLFAMVLTVVALFATANNALAQGTVTPNTEFYAGYQLTNSDVKNFSFDNSASGFNASATWYASEIATTPFGLTAEGTGSFKNGESLVTALAGLTVKARQSERFQPFVRGLAGVARTSIGNADTGFSFAVGGGLDVKVAKTVSLRVFQADYLQTQLFGQRQDNLRLGAGIVF